MGTIGVGLVSFAFRTSMFVSVDSVVIEPPLSRGITGRLTLIIGGSVRHFFRTA